MDLTVSLVAQMVQHLPTMQETQVWSLGWEDLLQKEMAIHFSTLAWKIPWTEERGRLQSMESQRVRYDWATSLSFLSFYIILLVYFSRLMHWMHLRQFTVCVCVCVCAYAHVFFKLSVHCIFIDFLPPDFDIVMSLLVFWFSWCVFFPFFIYSHLYNFCFRCTSIKWLNFIFLNHSNNLCF